MIRVSNYLPTAPRYYSVKLDDGRTLTFHHFARRPLRRGDRARVCGGLYDGELGTVRRRTSPRRGYSYRIRRVRRFTVEV